MVLVLALAVMTLPSAARDTMDLGRGSRPATKTAWTGQAATFSIDWSSPHDRASNNAASTGTDFSAGT